MQKDFINATPDSGGGNGTVTVTASQNTGSARSTSITISGGGVTKTISISQSEGLPKFTWTMFEPNSGVSVNYLRPDLGVDVPSNIFEASLIVPSNGLVDLTMRFSLGNALNSAVAEHEGQGVVTSVTAGGIITCAIDNIWMYNGRESITVDASLSGGGTFKFYIDIVCQMG